jgi:putative FmdB family regulatory protein
VPGRRRPGILVTKVPLYDFRCRACGNEFEALVRPGHPPVCPGCQSEDLERQLSTFAMTTRDQTQARADVKRKKEAHTARRDTAAMDREILAHRREDH